MIKVKITKKDNEITSILLSGHSGYDIEGKDIVCSSCSSIVITTVNAILRIDEDSLEYEKKDGYLNITMLKQSDTISILLNNMIELLEELEKENKKYIKIKYEEV